MSANRRIAQRRKAPRVSLRRRMEHAVELLIEALDRLDASREDLEHTADREPDDMGNQYPERPLSPR